MNLRTTQTPLLSLTSVLAAALLGGCDSGASQVKTETPEQNSGSGDENAAPLKAEAATAEDLEVYLDGLSGAGDVTARFTTTMGVINCKLDSENAPISVANFVGLARGLHPFRDSKTNTVVKRPFYDGLIFHRVIPEFMIQGGDQDGTGSGGPGFTFPTEVSDALSHDKPGTLAMANAGPDTNGSQFYITEQAVERLDGGYNVFGYCDNVEAVKTIARVPTESANRPKDDVVMTKVEILRAP